MCTLPQKVCSHSTVLLSEHTYLIPGSYHKIKYIFHLILFKNITWVGDLSSLTIIHVSADRVKVHFNIFLRQGTNQSLKHIICLYILLSNLYSVPNLPHKHVIFSCQRPCHTIIKLHFLLCYIKQVCIVWVKIRETQDE